jgi:hypothetical protein
MTANWRRPARLTPERSQFPNKDHCRDFRGKSTWVFAAVDELLSREYIEEVRDCYSPHFCIRQDFLKRRLLRRKVHRVSL